MASSTENSFKAKHAFRGYHAFKETTWNNIKEGDSVRVDLETNKLKHVQSVRKFYFLTRGKRWDIHIPREISRHVYYFIKTEGAFVNGSVISTKYCPSPVPSGGLKIPLLLNFLCPKQKAFEKMKNFVDSFDDCDYSGVNDEQSSDEEEATIVIETDQSKPVTHRAADQSKLVSYTDSSSQEEEDLEVDVLMNQLTWPLINFLFLK